MNKTRKNKGKNKSKSRKMKGGASSFKAALFIFQEKTGLFRYLPIVRYTPSFNERLRDADDFIKIMFDPKDGPIHKDMNPKIQHFNARFGNTSVAKLIQDATNQNSNTNNDVHRDASNNGKNNQNVSTKSDHDKPASTNASNQNEQKHQKKTNKNNKKNGQ